jgi:hypothetical protein
LPASGSNLATFWTIHYHPGQTFLPASGLTMKPSRLPVILSTLPAVAISSALLAQPGTINPDAAALPASRTVPAENLAAARIDRNWQIPKTSWGHPDLQGIWSSDDMRGVPRDRPQAMAEREFLTEEEFARRAGNDQAGLKRATNDESFLRNEFGTRTFGYTSMVVAPANGRLPPMTEAAMARAGPRDRGTFGNGPFNTFEDFTLYDRCITRGIVGSVIPVLYGNGMRILQTPEHVVISYEMIHDTRIIPLQDQSFIDGRIRQYLGNSRARWEDDTLVIETRNLTDRTSIGSNGNGTRHSEQMVITERMTRVDPDMIDYYITVEDPPTYTEPFTLRLTITAQPGYQLYEYSCHEGNGAVGNTLSGERFYESKVAEALAAGLPPPARGEGNIYATPEEGAELINVGP